MYTIFDLERSLNKHFHFYIISIEGIGLQSSIVDTFVLYTLSKQSDLILRLFLSYGSALFLEVSWSVHNNL